MASHLNAFWLRWLSRTAPMHVLITGAGGFTGSHMVAALLARGHRVTAVCRSSHGLLDPERHRGANLSIIRGDLADDLTLPDNIDAIVHAAARSNGPGVMMADLVRDNATATARLVAHAWAAGAKTFIYLSSLSVNGRISGLVVDEQTPIIDPDAYGMSKHLGELIVREEPSLRSLSLRLPGVIGKGSVRNWLTSVLTAAKENRPITLFNGEAQFNNAVHVTDLCAFVAALLHSDWSGHDVVMLGAAGATTTRRAVNILVEATGSRSLVGTEVSRRPPYAISIERARKLYGYAPMQIETMLQTFAAENQGRGAP
jgi:nucleoside-diphosphate-sugar epimerase